ncbi:MAG TPA: FAD-dependent oxidoreductase [Streptosporangiaceae bacterium]|nr:FAD-dependent oxidoreductase [Streptosporangiaceae bacterium]
MADTRTDSERYRSLSLWHETFPGTWLPRAALPGDRTADVAIVGAGYTGLWTAYYLQSLAPTLRITIVESEVAGFGASGRNGGWCSSIFPASRRRIAREGDEEDVRRMQRAMNDSVDEVGRVAAMEDIDCHYVKGGYLSVARNPAQWQRAQDEVAEARRWGFGDDHLELLGATATRERIRARNALGATYARHCAALHPARLVRGLAEAVERRGAVIYEQTKVSSLEARTVVTDHGTLTADVVVLATEGFTPTLAGHRRDIVPMYSLMVATEPLPQQQWESIGLGARETFSDKRHLRIYGQRTADGRLAFGGRGAPYHFASRVQPSFDRDASVHNMLQSVLRELLPGIGEVDFTHAWGGNLGIPRDWFPSVRYDRRSGLAWAGGYVGDGVATSNLAGRTLAQLITGQESELTSLPWAQRRSRRWEPEPLRWAGVNAVTRLMTAADRGELRTGRPSRMASAFWRSLGH